MSILSGIHPVAEALRAHRPLERVHIAQGAGGPRLQEIIDLARRAGVPVRFEPRSSLDRLAASSAHQGVVALGAARKYTEFEAVASSELLVVLVPVGMALVQRIRAGTPDRRPAPRAAWEAPPTDKVPGLQASDTPTAAAPTPASPSAKPVEVTKLATIETGAQVRVPGHIRKGDRIKVRVEDGEFRGRAN